MQLGTSLVPAVHERQQMHVDEHQLLSQVSQLFAAGRLQPAQLLCGSPRAAQLAGCKNQFLRCVLRNENNLQLAEVMLPAGMPF